MVNQERSKALGYIESNVATAGLQPMDDREAQRAPDNVNQLHIAITQCKDIYSRRKGECPVPLLHNNNRVTAFVLGQPG